MEDKEIIGLYIARDEQAIAETSDKYGSYLHKVSMNIIMNSDDAEEILSDTYLGAWNTIPPQIPLCLSAYLSKITRNLSIKKWRLKHTLSRGEGQIPLALEELSECISSGHSIDTEIESREITELLNRFLSELPKLDRMIFMNRYWYLRSIRDLSAHFGFSESKIKSNLHRTREKLRTYLEKEGVSIEI